MRLHWGAPRPTTLERPAIDLVFKDSDGRLELPARAFGVDTGNMPLFLIIKRIALRSRDEGLDLADYSDETADIAVYF